MVTKLKNSSTEPLFTSSQVLKAVNITYRQLCYWELKDIIKPIFQRQGVRDFKRYTHQDIDSLKRIKKLLDEGYNLPTTDTLGEIAKRKELEEKLKESEQKFRDLVETTTDWVWEVDRDGVYTYASPKVKDLLGYEVSEVVGRTPFDLMPEEEAKKISEFFYDKVANKKTIFRLENINIHKDGRRIVLETSGIPIFDEKENLKGYRGIDRDITKRKKAEEKQALRFEILKIFHQQESLKNMCEKIISLIKEYLNCDVVALRIKEDEDYPYFVNNGFSQEFIKSENSLCVRDERGNYLKDSRGKLIIACMCGIVINAKFNQDKPFFTENGSFWSNSTTDLLAATEAKDRGTTTRNVCNQYGYESVALIPVKSRSDNIGLLQINDKRRNLFSSDNIKFLEEIGHITGMVVERKWMEEVLLKSEDKHRKFFEKSNEEIAKFIQSKR